LLSMSPILIMLGALPWLLILLHLMFRRGFVVLLLWLLVAPVVMYVIQRTDQEVIYQTAGSEKSIHESDFYYENPAKITLQKLLNPTRMLISLLFIIFVVNALLKKTHWDPLDRVEIWMSIFSLILLANVVLWSGRLAFGLHVAVDAFIVPFLAYFVTRRLVRSEDRFRKLNRIIGYMGVSVIVYCIFERLTTPGLMYRLGGPFGSRDVLHVVMVVVFFTVLLDSLSTRSVSNGKRGLSHSIRYFLILMAPVVIALTIQRGNWLGFLAGLFVFLFLGRRLLSLPRQLRTIGLLLIVVPVIALALIAVVPQEFFEERVADQHNVLGRFATWVATIQLASEGPVFGVGLNNLHGLLGRTQLTVGHMANYSTPHNSYLSILVELGAIGLLVYLGIVASIVKRAISLYKSPNPQDVWRGITVIAVMVAYQVPSLFSNIFYTQGLIHVYVYVFAGAVAGLYSRHELRSRVYGFALAAAGRKSHQLRHFTGHKLASTGRASLR
jgi:O-antigen ligase